MSGRRLTGAQRRDPRRAERSHLLWGTGAVLALACAVLLLFWRPDPFAGGYDIRAAFVTSNNLQKSSPVRIAGVRVGTVTGVQAGPGGRGSIVEMHIDDGVVLHRDMRLKIRPRLLLEGAYYVDVQPGSPSAARVEDADDVVGVRQTATPVQLGHVLTALQDDTREDLQDVVDELGRALEDEGGAAGLSRTARWLQPAYRDTAIASEATLGEADDDVDAFVEHAGTFAAALNRRPEALTGLVENLAVTADALAREDEALGAAIGELPGAFAEGRRSLAAVRAAMPPLRRLTADLRPAVRAARPAVQEGARLLAQGRALMGSRELGRLAPRARSVAPPLARLTRSAVPLNEELRALSNCQVHTTGPASEDEVPDPKFPPGGKVYEELGFAMPGLAGESRGFDANGQYVKVGVTGAQYAYALRPGEFFLTGTPLAGVNPGPAPAPALRPDVPCETQEPPDLRSNPLPPPKAIRVRQDAPGAAARRARALRRAVSWLRRDLRRRGLRDIAVSTKSLSLSQLPALRRESAALRRGGR